MNPELLTLLRKCAVPHDGLSIAPSGFENVYIYDVQAVAKCVAAGIGKFEALADEDGNACDGDMIVMLPIEVEPVKQTVAFTDDAEAASFANRAEELLAQ